MSALPVPPLHDEPPRERTARRPRWKKVLAWIAAGVGILILLAVIGVIVLLHSARFHQYVLRLAEQKASAGLGSRVQVRDFALHWSGLSPSLDVYSVTVDGAAPYPTPPLLQVDHARLQITISSLLRRTWYMKDIRIDHPVVRVFVDRHGTDNLPQTRRSNQQSHMNVFNLGVRHAMLDRGEVYYDNRKSVLDADLHDLTFRATFDTGQRSYSGTLSYRKGHLRMENLNPLPHDLDARFTVTQRAFTLQRAVLSSGASQFVLTATLEDYAHPRLRASYDAVLDTGQLRRVLKNLSVPAGIVRTSGSMHYATQPNRPMLDALTLEGSIGSQALALETSSVRTELRNLGARYSVQNGNLAVRDLRAGLLGGELSGSLVMRDITGASRSTLNAALRGVSLADLRSAMRSAPLQQTVMTGTINATADATWGKTFGDLVARSAAGIQARVASRAGGNTVPLNGAIHARYTAANKQLSLTQSYIGTPETSINLNGTISQQSALQVSMQSNNLHELETLATILRPAGPAKPAQPLGVYGTGSFVGAVRGSTSAPRITGQLSASNLRVKGSAWRLVRTNVDASPSGIILQNGELQPADRGRITFSLSAGLRRWAFTPASPFQVTLKSSQVNAADLTKAAGLQVPITGTLNANISAHGSELNPMGSGTVSLSQARVAGEPVQALNVNFQGTGEELRANAALRAPAGVANALLTYYPKERGYDVRLQANGINLAQLQAIKSRNLQLQGVLNLSASGRGTLANPELKLVAEVPKLDIRNQTISGLKLQAALADHVANFALDSEVVNTYARARGTVNLTGPYYTEATLETQSIPLAPLIAAYAPSQAGNINGQTEIHGTLRGPLKNRSQLDAHVTIPQLAVNYKNTVQLAAANPIHIDYANGILQLQRTAIRGTGTDLQIQGTIPSSSTAPVSLLLLGTIDLRLAELVNPDITSSGQLRFDINSYGQRANPDVQGRIEVVNASFATGGAPIGLQNGNGVLTLTKNRLDINQFSGTVGGGMLRASGGVVYRPSLQFDLGLAAKQIRMLYPQGVRSAIDTNLALTGSMQAATLRGQVRIDDLSFTPDFDLMDFMSQFSGVSTPPPAQGFSNNLQLNLTVQSTTGLNLVSRTLSLQAAANLEVRGTAAEPVVLGRVNLNGGDLIFMGNRYVLQAGTVQFVNPSRTQPVLDVGVNTTIDQYNIQMRFWGPVDHLHTTYASDPALPPADIIHLMGFGKTTEAAAANPAPPGNLGAQSLIASQVSNQITSRVEKIVGISRLSVDPILSGVGGRNTPGARVTIQQRVTSKIFVTFSTDVTSIQNQVVQLEYQVNPRMSVSGTRNQNGGFAIDTRFRKSW